jgi:DNA-binding LacI/PurR family transcriptional regulator
MADIAVRAGVSRIAVSYALNDRPGVSADTRERIRALAREMGYRANGPARAMHGAAAQAVGLVMSRSSAAFTVEVFRRELIAGIQAELSARGWGLALRFVAGPDEEIAVYRRWRAERRVDGVLLIDPRAGDPRPDALAAAGLPAVVVGGPPAMRGLWTDDGPGSRAVLDHLVAAGHTRLARVSGPPDLLHTAQRDAAFRAAPVAVTIVAGDYTGTSGARITRDLLSAAEPPTAIVYDNDLMAVAGLGVAHDLGVDVPGQLSIVAHEDSPLCRTVSPPLTALCRDIPAFGASATRLLVDAIAAGGRSAGAPAVPPSLVIRGSSGRYSPGR